MHRTSSEDNNDDKQKQEYEQNHSGHTDAAFQNAFDLTSVSSSPINMAFGEQSSENESAGNGAANQSESSDKKRLFETEIGNLHHS